MNKDIIDQLMAQIAIHHQDSDVYQEAISEIRDLRRRIHELETKLGWYRAVNAQLRDDLIEANADFQALARTPAPIVDPLDAIVLGIKRENEARKDMR